MVASRSVLVLAAALAVACGAPTPAARADPPPAREGIVGRDDREVVVPDRWPFLAVGRLNLAAGGFCTASLVAPGRIVAASHCMPSGPDRALAARSLRFLAGFSRGRYAATGEGAAIHPASPRPDAAGAPLAGRQNDWATVDLARGDAALAGLRPLPIHRGPVANLVGRTVMMAGYHHDHPSDLLVQRTCRILAVLPQPEVFLHDCDLTGRSSGSPILIEEDGGWHLVGIAIAYIRDAAGTRDVGVTIPPESAGEE